jgi:hypothetical protein
MLALICIGGRGDDQVDAVVGKPLQNMKAIALKDFSARCHCLKFRSMMRPILGFLWLST